MECNLYPFEVYCLFTIIYLSYFMYNLLAKTYKVILVGLNIYNLFRSIIIIIGPLVTITSLRKLRNC